MATPSPSSDQGQMDLFLCIDGGGTNTRVTIAGRTFNNAPRHATAHVQVLSRGSHPSSNCAELGPRKAALSIGDATLEALRASAHPISRPFIDSRVGYWSPEPYRRGTGPPPPAPFLKIWAGLSGVNVQAMTLELTRLFGLESPSILQVTHDGDLLSGVIENHYRLNHSSSVKVCRGGIVLIAGTGSVCVAYGPHEGHTRSTASMLKPIARLGGYGYLLGDEGSSFHVGKETLQAILHDHDCTEPHHLLTSKSAIKQSSLVQEVLKHFQVSGAADLLNAVYQVNSDLNQTEHDRKVRIAEVSRLVMKCAFPAQGEPDPFAERIMRRSAGKLCDLLIQLCEAHHLYPPELVLCLGGGMYGFEAFKDLVLSTHEERTGKRWGWVEVVSEPDHVGALLLATRSS